MGWVEWEGLREVSEYAEEWIDSSKLGDDKRGTDEEEGLGRSDELSSEGGRPRIACFIIQWMLYRWGVSGMIRAISISCA
jgi:hypothetical protein